MKNLLKKYFLFISLITICSCEGFFDDQVVDVSLENARPKLVVEALINWEKGTTGNNQTIRLSKSAPFFNTSDSPLVSGANIRIENSTGDKFEFTENNEGLYVTTNFKPKLKETYTLIIDVEGEEIRATETLIPIPIIENVRQDKIEIFGEEIPTINFTFQDTPDEENFFFFEYFPNFQPQKDTDFADDEFQDGNEIEYEFSSEYEIPGSDEEIREFKAGDIIDFALFGISEQFYEYFNIINEQSDPEVGPFSLAPAEAKGNCINITNPENRPLGYFRLSEVSREKYTYQ